MRDLLEKYRSARIAVAVVAGCCVLALVQAAAAHNDLDMREAFRSPAPQAPPTATVQTEPHGEVSIRQPTARPLRIALRRTRHQDRRVAERLKPARHVAAHHAPPTIRLAVLPPPRDTMFDPLPQQPALVSIYEDQTLRRGDAVMMMDGLQVFNGQEAGPHRPGDFVRLTHAPSVDWRLRKTLSAFENNPPDHWRS